MKYLKLYESFKSSGISKTLKFLKNKVSNESARRFVSTLKLLMENIDFPINEISDSNIKYMSAKKALQLRSDKEVTNPKGIWVIKYWFSVSKGYLGYTATGNEEKEIQSTYHSGLRTQTKFSEEELDYIKNNITKTGEIWPVENYRKLKTGDTVIGLFDSSSRSREHIGLAKVFVDQRDNRRTYAIQNVSSGSGIQNPDWENYTQYGRFTWWMYDNGELGSDHSRLHYWRESEDELHYIEPPVEKEEEKEIELDPLTWNIPLSNRYAFSNWGRGSSIEMSSIKEADFALVLYFDELVNPDTSIYKKPSDIRSSRVKEKQGATSLMTDKEIKRMNIERYVKKISATLNITETEFCDLQKIVSKHLAQEFSYISIYSQSPNWSNITDFTDYFYQIIDGSEGDKPYYLNRAKSLYESRVKEYYNKILTYQEAKAAIKGDTELKKIFDEIFKVGEDIFQHFAKMKIDSIDDLWLTKQKVNNLYQFIRFSRNLLSYQVREVISGFKYTDEIGYYFDQYKNNYDSEVYKRDLEKLQRIRAFLKSL